MSNEHIKSTADHAEHSGLLDQTGWNTQDGFINLRETDGNLGVQTVGSETSIVAYSNKTDTHSKVLNALGNPITFQNESDARVFVDQAAEQIKSQVVLENRPESSIEERERFAAMKARHAEERKSGSHIKGNGVFLDY